MSSHRDRDRHLNSRIAPSAAAPQAPPPPVLSSRSRPSSRRSRSRSRSRTPPASSSRNNSRYGHSSRDRGRRESPSPYASIAADSYRKAVQKLPSSALLNHSSIHQQSISLITGEAAPPIIRRILNADEVKIPRRVGEGARPVFDREELKEAMMRRMREDDDEENPPLVSPQIVQPPQQQRVIAIIREPAISLSDSYRLPSSMLKESSSYAASRHSHLQPISPESLRPSTAGSGGFRRSSLSPVQSRERGRRSVERAIDRKRDLLYEHREREQELRERVREQEAHARERARGEERGDREIRERYTNSTTRQRSRSPIKILRDRRSRSRSVTPPPMPPEIRRQILERERDLRSKLSRPLGKSIANKFESDHDFRLGSRGGRGFGRGISRGRGFTRGLRGRVREEGHGHGRSREAFWEHDMFEKEIGLDQPGGDSKSKSSKD